MSLATTIPWFLSVTALAFSIGAFAATRRSSDRSLLKQLAALSERLAEQEDLTERQSLAYRNLRSRLNMQAHREKAAGTNGQSGSAPMTEDEKDRWTRETNLKIATGQLKLR